MNFVCFSFLSPPSGDAESACVGRFLSALAEDGHTVHLVSLEHLRQIDESVEKELLSEKIIITRVPIKRTTLLEKWVPRFKYALFGIGAEYIQESCVVLSATLAKYESPVLLTRAAFPVSNVIGWHCRQHAALWIAHFSDPYPTYSRNDFSYWIKKMLWRYPFDYLWCWRILRDADQITVTAQRAKRYFNKISFFRFQNKINVLYHIGLPRLVSGGYSIERSCGNPCVVAHVGHLMAGRHPKYIVDSFLQAPSNVVFHQYGVSDVRLPASTRFRTFSLNGPRMATDAMATADALIVSDLKSNFGYCPYLTSKFAYALALNIPVICISDADSEVADFSKKYEGVYFADYKDKGALVSILELLSDGKLLPPEEELISLFKPRSVLDVFYGVLGKSAK